MKVYMNTSQAYLGTLNDVLENPDAKSSPRGSKTLEKFDYMFKVLKPTTKVIETYDKERNKKIKSYSDKEFELYERATNSVQDMAEASKFWLKIQNPDGTINSNYGYNVLKRKWYGSKFEVEHEKHPAFKHPEEKVYVTQPKMRSPYEYCVEALRRDPNTRQAIMKFAHPEVFWFGNKDVTCTLHGAFNIRNNKLNLTINMRSNDLMLGLVYDLPWFVSLMYRMKSDLNNVYPDLKVGTYTHFVHNIHIYEKDIPKIEKMLGRVSN